MNTKNTLKFSPFQSILLAALAVTTGAHAQFLSIEVTDYGNAAGAGPGTTQARTALDTLFTEMETAINGQIGTEFDIAQLTPFTAGTAKATASASSGVGTDYASDFTFGLVGVNLALGTSSSISEIKELVQGTREVTELTSPGVAAMGSITLGLSFKNFPKLPLPLIDSTRARGYLGFFSRSQTFAPDGGGPALKVGMLAMSAQGQYQLIEAKSVGLGMAKWGGVVLGGGLRFTKSDVEVIQSLASLGSQTENLGAEFGTATASFSGNGIVGVNTKVFSLPLEVSTSARLLHVLGIFVGTGLDINLGGATSGASIDGPIALSSTGGSISNISGVVASATADQKATGGPGLANFKYFAGVQVEVLAVAVSLQLTGTTNGSKALNAGVKAFW